METGTMRPDRSYLHRHRSLEKLKEEWAEFSKEVFSALQEQQAKMSAREDPRNLDSSEEYRDG
jgi:hypothetical protein